MRPRRPTVPELSADWAKRFIALNKIVSGYRFCEKFQIYRPNGSRIIGFYEIGQQALEIDFLAGARGRIDGASAKK